MTSIHRYIVEGDKILDRLMFDVDDSAPDQIYVAISSDFDDRDGSPFYLQRKDVDGLIEFLQGFKDDK